MGNGAYVSASGHEALVVGLKTWATGLEVGL